MEDRANLEYYHSSQFKDKYAKENLGKIRPGEKVLILSTVSDSTLTSIQDSGQEQERQDVIIEDILRKMPVVEHWRLFLFEQEKLEELRK
jgi:hypothetical protein